MSRSYKKNGYSTFACYKSDKWCKTAYNKNRRHKDKISCKKYEGITLNNVDFSSLIDDVDFPKNRIDYSVRMSDKYSWCSDGGNYFCDDIYSMRKEFEDEVFSLDYRWHKQPDTIWDKYHQHLEKVFNNKKKNWVVKLERKKIKKIDFGFYMPWNEIRFPSYETEVKYLEVGEYPPTLIKKDKFKGWEVKNWWAKKNYLTHSNWELFGFLFKNNMIPLDFKSEEELFCWLRKNQEIIIEKWLKAKLLRK